MEHFSRGYPSLLLFLSSLPLALSSGKTQSGLKCHPYLTLNVTGNLIEGGLSAFGYHFSEGYYRRLNETHFSVCICNVTKCLRKCCDKDEVMHNKRCSKGFDVNPIAPNVYDKNLRLLYNYDLSQFVRVYGDTCKDGWFELDPDNHEPDKSYLLDNGKLYLPHGDVQMHLEPEEFCFENEIPSNQTSSQLLRVHVCLTEEYEDDILKLLPIGMIISIPFLLATFLVYAMPELRNLHGKNLMGHVGSLFVAYLFLVVVQMANDYLSQNTCIAMGFMIQYAFLAAFFWLNVMCFDIWLAFSGFSVPRGDRTSSELQKYTIYSIYGWGCPGLISLITIVMQFAPGIPDSSLKPDIGRNTCFFSNEKSALAYFYGPSTVILLFDVIFFIVTALKILMVKKETGAVFRDKDSSRNKEASKQRYVLYLKLFLIMGVSWIMEVISWAVKGPTWIWYVSDFTNTLQGVFTFVIFVLNAKTKDVISNRLSSQTMKSYIKREFSRSQSASVNGNSPSNVDES